MAKTSKIVRNEQRKALIAKYADKRAALRTTIQSMATSDEEKQTAYSALRKLPRDSSPTRYVNRCAMSGRPRAYLRQFGLSRIAFREMALQGLIPGVTKASW
ncbi:MAG: 30S ribosomal protein S14 [Candidatus Eremiobacteraeota bacterium]|nr:30S ribosomal protein S14 [Candidatus Eremiobacteraeota bacterium]